MEQDGYAPGESIAFDFENGSETYTYQGKIAGSFVSADTYLVIPEGVYRSMNPREQPMAICGWTVIKKMLHLWNRV